MTHNVGDRVKHTATGRVGEVVDAADEKGNHMVMFTEVGPGAKVVQKFANMNRTRKNPGPVVTKEVFTDKTLTMSTERIHEEDLTSV
jgi:hypothetical protein